MAILKKGTKITCPLCRDVMCSTTRDIYWGEKMKDSDFLVEVVSPICGDKPVCPHCNALFINNEKVHTENGWV